MNWKTGSGPRILIGNSNAMRDIYRQIHQVSPSDTTVLIRGESGTGKELVAHAIHFTSPRKDGPFHQDQLCRPE